MLGSSRERSRFASAGWASRPVQAEQGVGTRTARPGDPLKKLLLAGLFALFVGTLCGAHGGRYPPGGPASTLPPSGPGSPRGGPPSARTPNSGAEDLSQWQYWWMFNQAPYLQLNAQLRKNATATPGEESNGVAHGTRRVSAELLQSTIVPRLLEALKTEGSNDIQSSCMIALGKIGEYEGGPEAVALQAEVRREIQKRLVSKSQELSETATISLGIAGSSANIPVLVALLENDRAKLRGLGVPQLDDVDLRTRAFAAYGLGLIGHQAGGYERLVINACLRRMFEGEARAMTLRDVPVACLIAIGLTPLPVAVRASEPDAPPQERELGALVSRQDQLRFLLACFRDRACNALTRAQAPTAMARLLNRDDVPESLGLRALVAQELMQCLAKDSKQDSVIQQSCVLALGMIGDCDEDPLDVSIRATLTRSAEALCDLQARRFALIAVAQTAGRAGRGAGDPLHGINTRDFESNVRRNLLAILGRDRTEARAWSALALAVLERSLADAGLPVSVDVQRALKLSLAESNNPEHIGAFAIACGIAQVADAKDVLIRDLSSMRDLQARGHAALALGLLNERSAIAPIAAISRQSKYHAELLRSSALALGLFGDAQLVPDLIDRLRSAPSLSTQAALGVALGTIGDSRSVPALIDLLRSKSATDLARAFGAVALGIVGGREDLPWNAKIAVGSNYRANTSSLTDGAGGIIDIL